MTAGVPGTGVGGLFYLAAAVLLPVRGVVRRLRGQPVEWPTVLRQLELALGVLASIWATGWLVGVVLGPVAQAAQGVHGTREMAAHYENIVRGITVAVGFATLAVVLLMVQVARLMVRK